MCQILFFNKDKLFYILSFFIEHRLFLNMEVPYFLLTERKLNVHKRLRRRPRCLFNVSAILT